MHHDATHPCPIRMTAFGRISAAICCSTEAWSGTTKSTWHTWKGQAATDAMDVDPELCNLKCLETSRANNGVEEHKNVVPEDWDNLDVEDVVLEKLMKDVLSAPKTWAKSDETWFKASGATSPAVHTSKALTAAAIGFGDVSKSLAEDIYTLYISVLVVLISCIHTYTHCTLSKKVWYCDILWYPVIYLHIIQKYNLCFTKSTITIIRFPRWVPTASSCCWDPGEVVTFKTVWSTVSSLGLSGHSMSQFHGFCRSLWPVQTWNKSAAFVIHAKP